MIFFTGGWLGRRIALWTLLGLGLTGQTIWATDWYIANGGSDANACTVGAKCASFNRLIERSQVVAGDTLNVQCGDIYRETVTDIRPINSGTSSSNRMTVQPYGSCYSQGGVHEGPNNAANLTDAGVNFSTLGVQAGHRLFNLSKGAHCYVSAISTTTTINDTLVCTMGVAHDLDVDWDTGDRYSIANKPIVTNASLFNSGWSETSAGSNIWTHPFTKHPGRHVWVNGKSTLAMLHDGTCSVSGMGSASDGQFCAICNSGTGRSCGPGTLYVKSTSNPATRWTNPGVEVVHLFDYGQTLFQLSDKAWWTVRDLAIEKVYGTTLGTSGNNVLLERLRLGYSQRKNCGCAGDNTAESCPSAGTCAQGRNYPWLYGQDERGSELLKVGGPVTGVVVRDLLGHDCENNCLSLSGASSITLTVDGAEFFNNAHSVINSGLSATNTSTRTLTMNRLNIHGASVAWHSGQPANVQHTATVSNMLVYDVTKSGDPRQIRLAGLADPYNIYLENPGTYTIEKSVLTQGGHGIRISNGTLTVRDSVIQGNNTSGVNATSNARVRLNNNIIADNGTGTVASTRFQVGCATNCSTVIYSNTQSDNNKFRQSSGAAFGYMSGIDTSMDLSEWRAMAGGNAASVVTDDCFVNATSLDYNLATGCDDIAATRGPYREMTPAGGAMQGTVLELTMNVGGALPVSVCHPANLTVEYNNVAQTIVNCAANQPLGNTVRATLSTAPPAGSLVEVRGAYGAAEDSLRIGGALNAKSRAFSDIALTNAAVGCLVGTDRAVPAGSNRVLLVMHGWEKQNPANPPLRFTSCTYGGQSMTLVTSAIATNSTEPQVLADAWIVTETGIAAATSTQIACTLPPTEVVDGGRPVLTISCPFSNINQTTPVLDSETATQPTATSVTTASLSTSNPGVGVQLAISGNAGSWAPGSGWTEQFDVAEDTDPGMAAHLATRDTTGSTITGNATFTPTQTFGNRLAMVTVALNGGSGPAPPEESASLRQVATRCILHNEEGFVWSAPQNTPCRVVSGHSLVVLSEYLNEGAAEAIPIGKQLQCCTSGTCTQDGAWVAVDDVGANGVRYIGPGTETTPPANFAHGTPLPNRLLTGPALTYVTGALHTIDSMIATPPLTTGQGSDVGHAIVVSIPAPATIQCRLARDNNLPLEVYDAAAVTTIEVLAAAAFGL